MSRSHRRAFAGLLAAALTLPLAGQAQKGAPATGEWRAYAADEGSTIRSTGGDIAATSNPWYLRVLQAGSVDDA